MIFPLHRPGALALKEDIDVLILLNDFSRTASNQNTTLPKCTHFAMCSSVSYLFEVLIVLGYSYVYAIHVQLKSNS